MNYVGVDLHKQIIVLCVVAVVAGKRRVVARKRLACRDTAGLDAFLASLGAYQLAVEATAAYEWLLQRVEGKADRMVLVHPRKMRIIAESRRKTDKLDAQILAEQYAGLAPDVRESAGRRQNLSITKEGSRLLRWAMIELAWRLVSKTRRWGLLYEALKARTGAKKAIVAVARRVLCVLVSLLKSGQRYRLTVELPSPTGSIPAVT
jgi:transposase